MGSHTKTCTRAAINPVAHMASISCKFRCKCGAALSCSDRKGKGPSAYKGGGVVSQSIMVPRPAPTVLSVKRMRQRSSALPKNVYHTLLLLRSGRLALPMAKQLSNKR
eukprot:scaffold8602_cov196-Amphora_coffeaeformis.AAC.12